MRRIAIMIGSDSDLKQCLMGLAYLDEQASAGNIKIVDVITNSIHRNTREVLENLASLPMDCLIAGAGMANHLSGTCDAYLRYGLFNDRVPVIAVAFEDEKNPENTSAADLSIRKVPGHQMTYLPFIGAMGFFYACKAAAEAPLPKISLPERKPVHHRSLGEAIFTAKRLIKIEENKKKETT